MIQTTPSPNCENDAVNLILDNQVSFDISGQTDNGEENETVSEEQETDQHVFTEPIQSVEPCVTLKGDPG